MTNTEQTYILDNVEVRLTGRTASRTSRSGKLDQLVEVTPTEGCCGTWKKWVVKDQLYQVESSN